MRSRHALDGLPLQQPHAFLSGVKLGRLIPKDVAALRIQDRHFAGRQRSFFYGCYAYRGLRPQWRMLADCEWIRNFDRLGRDDFACYDHSGARDPFAQGFVAHQPILGIDFLRKTFEVDAT